MGRIRHRLLLPLLLLPAALGAAAQERVVQAENVRLDYAQVLNVEPVYQTLKASRTEQVCDEAPAPKKPRKTEDSGRWARWMDSVKGMFSGDEPEEEPAKPVEPERICRNVPIEREFRRPIAYDVDYVYKGTKYRSRLAEDPGNRLRIRVSVMPYVPTPPPLDAP